MRERKKKEEWGGREREGLSQVSGRRGRQPRGLFWNHRQDAQEGSGPRRGQLPAWPEPGLS